ncbi:ribosomal protein S5 domain 2-type protein [Auriculariales sp. MPI-PUGE-AT-0066]|nr:ribosomal protein S5 domain 2-type protein [Auriculariales sp. MPI-PUGE-AT-0066]
MGSRVEILNDGGLRSDGRRQHELRSISIQLATQGSADGSALITHGLTTVLAVIHGPREARVRAHTMHDRAVISVDVLLAPFSQGERRKRGRGDRRTQELAASVKATFESAVQTNLYPRSEIDIFLHVLQQDGGVMQACVNATTLALINAGIAMSDYVCAISAGTFSVSPLLDLTAIEESDVPHLTLALLPRTGKVTLVTMDTRLHVERFEEIFRLAGDAAKFVHEEMRAAVRNTTRSLVKAMGGAPATSGTTANAQNQKAIELDEDMIDA